MELFLPSLALLGLAGIVIFAVFPRLSPFILVLVAIISLGFAVKTHLTLFGGEYTKMSWTTGAAPVAPYILVGTVILFSIGYILYLFFKKGPAATEIRLSPSPVAPPKTATNVVTSAIGSALSAASPNASAARKGVTESQLMSALSKAA